MKRFLHKKFRIRFFVIVRKRGHLHHPRMHGGIGHACRQAGSSLPQQVLASQKKKKKKTRMIIHYGRRRRRRRNTLLVLLLYCCCCCCASLFLLQNYCSRANTGPKKRPKHQCQKNPPPFFPSHTNQNKKVHKSPLQNPAYTSDHICITTTEETDRQTERASARAREDEPKSKLEANKGEQRWRHKEEEEEEGTAEVD